MNLITLYIYNIYRVQKSTVISNQITCNKEQIMLEYEFNYEVEQSMSDDVWGFDNQYPKYINYYSYNYDTVP